MLDSLPLSIKASNAATIPFTSVEASISEDTNKAVISSSDQVLSQTTIGNVHVKEVTNESGTTLQLRIDCTDTSHTNVLDPCVELSVSKDHNNDSQVENTSDKGKKKKTSSSQNTNSSTTKDISRLFMKGLVDSDASNLQKEQQSGSWFHSHICKGQGFYQLDNGIETVRTSWPLAPQEEVSNWLIEFNEKFKLDGLDVSFTDVMADLSLMKKHLNCTYCREESFYELKFDPYDSKEYGVNEVPVLSVTATVKDGNVCPHCEKCALYNQGECDGRLSSNGFQSKTITENNSNPIKLTIKRLQFICPHNVKGFSIPLHSLPLLIFPGAKVTWNVVYCILKDATCTDTEYTIQGLAKRYGVDVEVVEDIINCHMILNQLHRKNPPCRRIAIDEFFAYGGKYITMVIDADHHIPMALIVGKKLANLTMLFSHLNQKGYTIEVIASDDNASFRTSAQECLTNIFAWILDPFHLKKKLSYEVLTPATRAIKAKDIKLAKGEENSKEYATGVRDWLLTLDDVEKSTSRVSLVMKHHRSKDDLLNDKDVPNEVKQYIFNHPVLSNMLDLKSLLDKMYDCDTKADGERVFQEVYNKSMEIYALGPDTFKSFKTFASYIENRKTGILNYFDHKITSSIIEGFNSKIKVIKRRMRGFFNPTTFMLRCLTCFKGKVSNNA